MYHPQTKSNLITTHNKATKHTVTDGWRHKPSFKTTQSKKSQRTLPPLISRKAKQNIAFQSKNKHTSGQKNIHKPSRLSHTTKSTRSLDNKRTSQNTWKTPSFTITALIGSRRPHTIHYASLTIHHSQDVQALIANHPKPYPNRFTGQLTCFQSTISISITMGTIHNKPIPKVKLSQTEKLHFVKRPHICSHSC